MDDKTEPKLPILFIWDIDATLIGDSDIILKRWYLLELLKKGIQNNQIEEGVIPKGKITKITMDDAPMRLLRPYLRESLHKIRDMYPTSEFFIYSAGGELYVNMIVPWIEEQTGIKFRRPLLNLNATTYVDRTSKKSISNNFDILTRSLEEDYPALKEKKNKELVHQHGILFIDNADVLWDHKNKWIQCPDYNYKPVIDITQGIEKSILETPTVMNYMKQEKWFVEPSKDVTEDERNMMFHTFMALQYQTVLEQNRISKEDNFMPRFVATISKFKRYKKPFADRNLERIRKMLA